MLDHTTLSASQGPSTHSLNEDRPRDTDKTPRVVLDLAASVGNVRKYSSHLQEAVQDSMEIASSIELPRISTSTYPWQENKAKKFFLFTLQLQLIEQRYNLRGRDEIVRLLEKYTTLGTLLLDIHKQIVPYFPNAQFVLAAITDPDIDDYLEGNSESKSLVISIVTHSRPREALERLKQFYKDWWLTTPVLPKLKEIFSFNLECV
ncbi:MAG TPA: hypothetical protein VFA09_10140 [Ktedonobacteraceae bacterium]|nr:hypothetical protein [Ktedonobacteraceae bacterium]